MRLNSTPLNKWFVKFLVASVCALCFFTPVRSQVLFSENFDIVVPLPAGWSEQNLSTPVGIQPTWFQGNPLVFSALNGADSSYIAANYQMVDGNNTISAWLFTPSVTVKNGDQFTFYTRVPDAPDFADRLQVRLSTNGTSTNVGASATSVGDFTILLTDINPTYSLTGYPDTWTQFTATISGVPTPTPGRIAFRYYVESGGPAGDNSNFIGIDSVVYTAVTAVNCTGTPAPGNTISTATEVCPAIPFTLSLQNATAGTDVGYQWQSSSDGVTFTNITGATNSTYTTSQTAATYYQAIVTCNGNSTTSTPVNVTLSAASACYCTATATDVDPDFEKIALVEFGPLSNASTSLDGYEAFLTLTPTPTYAAGSTTPITITGSNTYGGDIVRVWIDFDHDGAFTTPNELVFEPTATSAGPYTGTITIPATALSGDTRMRIRLYDDIFGSGSTGPCGDADYGQVEDYTINITPCVPVTVSTQPAAQTVDCGNDAQFFVAAAGTDVSFQWQVRTSSSAAWTDIAGATDDTLNISSVNAASNGYEYRVVTQGGCSSVDFSNAASLTVNALVINVDPADYASCSPIDPAAPVALTITNVSGGSSSTTTDYPSGAINLAIPDLDDAVGVTDTITVPALPAGAVITGAKVTLNADHTYAGDMIIVLKAPNGQVLNLDYALSTTGGPGPTTGFVNTVISSTGTQALSSGNDPWTGTFRADAVTTPAAGNPPSSPSVIAPNANAANFAALYSVPDGDWVLGVYDYASPDAGTLLNWTLTLTYSNSSTTPFTGIWSPTTGLTTDAAGTVPYTGTEETTVYAAPTATTVYTVTVNNATCPAAPVQVPVRILNADPTVSVGVSPNVALYPGAVTTATATVTPSSSAASYQWYSNGVAIPGATSATYQAGVDAIGELSVEVSDTTICSGSVTASVQLRDSATTNLFIYPNPNNGQFQVRYNDQVNDLLGRARNITVYDSKGSRVLSRSYAISGIFGRMDVDLSKQPKGVYVIELTDASGRRLQTGRVIVH